VVEFLTDNTLGRIWYEMTQGNTALVDGCQYLVRRPNEIFLKPGEQSVDQDEQDTTELSQAELLQQTVYIQHRPIKDPRDIKMLDPACGSMHFGLYAFDLFEQLYAEAWDIEAEKGSDIFFIEEGVARRVALHEAYPSKEAFLADVPRLIIEHNIHGVDIDPRATQIAGLSLWLRAQKSWSDNSITPNQRPQVQRSNIVCAEPMPGETKLLKEFTSQIQPRVLGQLVEEIFDKMQLAGEAGALLKIEEEVQAAIEDAKSQKDEKVLEVQGGLFGDNQWEVRDGKRYYNFSDVSDDFWGQAEQLILSQLENYAEAASGEGSGQKRMFSADAAKGFSFIDLCRKKYDVVLMNPPFGKQSKKFEKIAKEKYVHTWKDMYSSFFELTKKMVYKDGFVGAITSSQFLYTKQMVGLRSIWLKDDSLKIFVQLGHGVLDDAMVETGLTVFSGGFIGGNLAYKDLRDIEDKSASLICNEPYILKDLSKIGRIEGSPFSFDANDKLLDLWSAGETLGRCLGTVATGNHTFDDFRFVRLFFEIAPASIAESWRRFDKGGEYQPFISPTKLLLDWRFDGAALRALNQEKYGSDAQVMQASKYWYRSGICYSHVSSVAFGPRVLNAGTIFSSESISIFLNNQKHNLALIGFMNSSLCQDLIWVFGRYRKIENRAVSGIPITAELYEKIVNTLDENTGKCVSLMMQLESLNETSPYFTMPDEVYERRASLVDIRKDITVKLRDEVAKIDEIVFSFVHSLGIDATVLISKPRESLVERYTYAINKTKKVKRMATLSYLLGLAFGRWNIDAEYCEPSDSFGTLPLIQPGAESTELVGNGILVVDNHFNNKLESLLSAIFTGEEQDFVQESTAITQVNDIEEFFVNPRKFFDYHLKTYSSSRRQAPIYWPIQTPSGSFTVYLYYHALSAQTLFSVINDCVDPEIKGLLTQISDLSKVNVDDLSDLKELEKLQTYHEELIGFREQLVLISKSWVPNVDDGVIINAAPLWSLFRHDGWRKKLNGTWNDLVSGQYDWSHMAYNFWPERVLRESRKDRSIAIAHELVADLWEEFEVPVGNTKRTKFVWQPKKITDAEFDLYTQQKIAQG
jgi:hypothetical protein